MAIAKVFIIIDDGKTVMELNAENIKMIDKQLQINFDPKDVVTYQGQPFPGDPLGPVGIFTESFHVLMMNRRNRNPLLGK